MNNRLQEVYDKCWHEAQRLMYNLKNYLDKNAVLIKEIEELLGKTCGKSVLASMAYDNCVGQMTYVADLAFKMNLFLEFQYPAYSIRNGQTAAQIVTPEIEEIKPEPTNIVSIENAAKDNLSGKKDLEEQAQPELTENALQSEEIVVEVPYNHINMGSTENAGKETESVSVEILEDHTNMGSTENEEMLVEALPEHTHIASTENAAKPNKSENEDIVEKTQTKLLRKNSMTFMNLSQFENSFLNVKITYIHDLNELLFYVWDKKGINIKPIIALQKTAQNLEKYATTPDTDEMIGLMIDEQLYRAILLNKTTKATARLIDRGEHICIDLQKVVCYRLPEKIQQIPKQAILCKLTGICNKNYAHAQLQAILTEQANENVTVYVESCKDNVLHVELIEKKAISQENNNTISESKSQRADEAIPLYAISAEIDEIDTTNTESLNSAEQDMWDDEPLGTTNALKAVLGFVPRDESRICRFYNPKTGDCFKGARCKLEHVAHSKDAFTKDVVPADAAYDMPRVVISYQPEQIINITVTFVHSLNAFYAQINDGNENRAPLIWEDSDIPHYKLLKKEPLPFDLVLARYQDGNWYRAQIRSKLAEINSYEVFYVDYGNSGIVKFIDLARCFMNVVKEPHRAELIHIADMLDTSISQTQRKLGVEMLCQRILNETFDVCVASHYEDISIHFIDKYHKSLIDKFLKDGLLKRIEI